MPAWLLDLVTRYGYGAVLAGVLLEGAGVPVPGETLLLAGAVLAHLGHLSLPLVMAAAVLGGIAGDNLGYFIGRMGGRRLAVRFGPPLGLTAARLAEFDRFFERHGPKTIFVARFITGLRVVCAVLAGGSGIAWRTFALFNAAGVVVWAVVIGSVGYLLGESWDRLAGLVGGAGAVFLAAAIAATVYFFVRARRAQAS